MLVYANLISISEDIFHIITREVFDLDVMHFVNITILRNFNKFQPRLIWDLEVR